MSCLCQKIGSSAGGRLESLLPLRYCLRCASFRGGEVSRDGRSGLLAEGGFL